MYLIIYDLLFQVVILMMCYILFSVGRNRFTIKIYIFKHLFEYLFALTNSAPRWWPLEYKNKDQSAFKQNMKPLFLISFFYKNTDGCAVECLLVMEPLCCFSALMPLPRQGPASTLRVLFWVPSPHVEVIPWEPRMAFPPRSRRCREWRHLWEVCRGHPSLFFRSLTPHPKRLKNC